MELDLIRAVQSIHTPFLDTFFEGITIFGEELFMVPLLAIIYWTMNKKFGETLAYTVFTSLLLNNTLKEMFSFERPIGKEGIQKRCMYTLHCADEIQFHVISSSHCFGLLLL